MYTYIHIMYIDEPQQKPWQRAVTNPSQEVPYPAETGASCSAWDEKNHPDCQGAKPAAWCKKVGDFRGMDGMDGSWVG